jgi:hypothetical protein
MDIVSLNLNPSIFVVLEVVHWLAMLPKLPLAALCQLLMLDIQASRIAKKILVQTHIPFLMKHFLQIN